MAWQAHYGYHGGHGTGVGGSIYDFKHPRAPSIPESTLLAMKLLFFPLSYQRASVLLCYPPPYDYVAWYKGCVPEDAEWHRTTAAGPISPRRDLNAGVRSTF